MLTSCCFQLIFGKIYKNYPPKLVLLTTICIFEIGSAICGSAPSSAILILGRAIAGVGSTGIFTGSIVSIVYIVPLRRRPIAQASFSALFAMSSVLSPLIGGALTDRVSWRWCFFINLPFGGLALLILGVFLELPKPIKPVRTWKEHVKDLDPIGNVLLVSRLTCLLLALQWGGSSMPWNSAVIITLLALSGVFLFSFLGVQLWLQDNATVPPRIASQRSILSEMIFVYYLPLYFQAIKNATAVQSGIHTIPFVLAVVISGLASGFTTSKIGFYVPAMILGPIIMSIGAGLFITLRVETHSSTMIGYQILLGSGMGLCQQVAILAAQFVLPKQDVSIGASLMLFSNQMGGAVFVSVAQTVFSNKLIAGLKNVSNVNSQSILNIGATELQNTVPSSSKNDILVAIVVTFLVGTIMAGIALLPALMMEWKNVNKVAEQAEALETLGQEGKTSEATKSRTQE